MTRSSIVDLRAVTATDAAAPSASLPPSVVGAFLLGDGFAHLPVPGLIDLAQAALDLAEGLRRRCLMPLGGEPRELVLVRRGPEVLVSHYSVGGVPEIDVLDRPVPLAGLLATCARALRSEAVLERDAEACGHLAARLEGCVPHEAPAEAPLVERTGGASDASEDVALAFGFAVQLRSVGDATADVVARSDLHALLFEGRLWAFTRGRRVPLARGPIVLVVARMVAAVRALVDAWEQQRGAHVRLRSGAFTIAVRLSREGEVQVTLGGEELTVTAAALDVEGAALPILRVASDLLRALVQVDRVQSKNLRVVALRDEVRALRRAIRARSRKDAFTNEDPDRLRLSSPPPSPSSAGSTSPGTTSPGLHARPGARLRFGERWRAEVEGLDAQSTYLCGDRVVVATARKVVALGRDAGETLWSRKTSRAASMMCGTALLRLTPEGIVEVWDVGDGEIGARTKIAPRVGAQPTGVFAGGGPLPPLAILAEGQNRLVAIDLRTGEPVWRYAHRGGGQFKMRRHGRVLVVVAGDGSVQALDVHSGELAWRFSDSVRFSMLPHLVRDVVVAVSGEPGAGGGAAYGIDLYSGAQLWKRATSAAPSCVPVAVRIPTGGLVVVASEPGQRPALEAFDVVTGTVAWTAADPGLARGGAALAVDDALVVNAPGGRVTALDPASGAIKWTRVLSHPVADDVPRRLEPILRGGALFVPAAQVHVLKPHDGTSVGSALDCDLVPDLLRVDERGWLYVAEDSGHLRAFAPAPHLSLVR